MEGRVCLITGANSGIGKAAAVALARRGATVVMLCRDEQRGGAAVDEVRRTAGRGATELLLCDLASQASIRAAADRYRADHDALHVLINNAGMNVFERRLTDDGIEMVLAVNYLAPFLLTNLLLDLLVASAPARVITVAGIYHRKARLDLDDLQMERGFDAVTAINRAQLAKVLFTYELARRLERTGVTANAVHPGAVRTPLQRKLPWHLRLLAVPVSLFFLSPARGAESYVYLACDESLSGVSGRYFNRRQETRSSSASYDAEAARRLWEVSERLTGLTA